MLERRQTGSRIVDLNPSDDRIEAPRGTAEPTANGLLRKLWRRRYAMLVCELAAIVFGLIYLQRAVPIYTSSSQIYVEQNNPQIIAAAPALDNTDANFLQTQCDVITSTEVLTRAADLPEAKQAFVLQGTANPVGYLKATVTAEIAKPSDLILVSAQSPSPEFAAVFANAVVQAYTSYQSGLHRSTSAEVLSVLHKEEEEAEEEYQTTSRAMLEFKRANATLSFESDKGNIILLRLSELSQALTSAQLNALDADLKANSADALNGDPAKLQLLMRADNAKTPEANGLTIEIQQMQSQIVDLIGTYGVESPQYRSFDKRLQALQAQSDRLNQRDALDYVELLEQEADAAHRRVNELQRQVDAQQKLALDLNDKAAKFAELDNNLRRTDKLIDTLDNRIKELHVEAGGDEQLATVSILETAKANPGGGRPRRVQTMEMSIMFGLILGVGVSLLLDFLDQRIRSADQIASLLDLPVLGVLPHMAERATHHQKGQEVHLHPKSEVAEAYRGIRTAIQFSSPDLKLKTILITSPSPGDGKTTVACNLAIAMSQGGRRVLIIDADCRRPMINKIFRVSEKTGLADILLGESSLETEVLHTNMPTLDVLPGGKVPSNPAELLHSEAFYQLLTAVEAKYDHVIIDSPPVAPVTDARILTAVCDATVLVLRAEKTGRRVSEYAAATLRSVGGSMLGLVINDAPRRGGDYYYYNGYHYYHYGNTNGNGVAEGNGARRGTRQPNKNGHDVIIAGSRGPDISPEGSVGLTEPPGTSSES